MHVIERKRPSRIKIFLTIFSVFFLLAGVTLYAGYRVFNTYFSQRDELSISLRIDGPTEVSAGEEASYTVRYKNPSGTKLTNTSIVANYSSGFVNITSDEYESTSQQTADMQKTWSTGDVSGTEGEVELIAKIIAPVASVQYLTIQFNYTPENFSSNFEKQETIEVTVKSSDLAYDITGPDIAFIDEEVEYKISFENTSEAAISNFRIGLEIPKSFTLGETDTSFTTEQGQKRFWEIETLEPKQKQEIAFSGHFTRIDNESEKFKVELALKTGDAYWAQDTKEKIVIIESKGNLSLDLLLNGSTESNALALGEEMNFSLVYENQSGRDLENLTMTAQFTTTSIEVLDMDSIKDQFKGKQDTDENIFRITWGQNEIKNLAKLAAGEKGVLNFSINVRDREILTILDSESLSELHIDTSVSLELKSKDAELKVVSNTFGNDIMSDLELLINSTRLNQEPGDLEFEITWLVSNTIHEVKDLKITSSFSDPVIFDTVITVDAGEFTHDESGNVLWKLNRMPANLLEPIQIIFRVRIPEEFKFSEHTILGETILIGTDTITASVIQKIEPAVVYSLRDQVRESL